MSRALGFRFSGQAIRFRKFELLITVFHHYISLGYQLSLLLIVP
jgi:hypothetical protein